MSARSAQGLGDSSRILLLPVELDESAEATVAFIKAHILRPGDVALFLHVVPSYTQQFQPALGFSGEAVIAAVRDVEYEQARRADAENFVTTKLQPMLEDVQGVREGRGRFFQRLTRFSEPRRPCALSPQPFRRMQTA